MINRNERQIRRGTLRRETPKRKHASRPLSHSPCVLPLPLLFQIYTDGINYVHHHGFTQGERGPVGF